MNSASNVSEEATTGSEAGQGRTDENLDVSRLTRRLDHAMSEPRVLEDINHAD